MTKDQFIVEVLGECWHEWEWKLVGPHCYDQMAFVCNKCDKESQEAFYPKLDTPEGFFWLWAQFQDHERWWEFLNKHGWVAVGNPAYPDSFLIDVKLINSLRFRDITAEFFGWKENR